MPSFGQRFRQTLRGMRDSVARMLGAGERAEPTPPAPPPAEDVSPPTPPPPPPSGGGVIRFPVPEPEEDEDQEHDIEYVPRNGSTLPYWIVYEPTMYDIRNLLNISGYGQDMIIIIHGLPCSPYAQTGSYKEYLSYRFTRYDVQDALDNPSNETAVDWINDLVSEDYISGADCWEEVYDIKVVDWKGPTR